MPIDIHGLSFEELLELNQRVVARLKMLESMQTHIEMMRFKPGQRVSFEHGCGRLLATLVKYNRKPVTVVIDNGQRWNIGSSTFRVEFPGKSMPVYPENPR